VRASDTEHAPKTFVETSMLGQIERSGFIGSVYE
jgi:hypothetical protein